MPTAEQVHVEQPLMDVSTAFMQDMDAFISGDVFPEVPVSNQGDKYYKYPLEAFTSNNVQRVDDTDETPGVDYDVNTDSYFAPVYGVHDDIGDQERANADDPFNLEEESTQKVTRELMIERENSWHSNYFTTGVWDTDVDVGSSLNKWDTSNGTPIDDIVDKIEAVESNTGFRPNTFVASSKVMRSIINNDNVIDRIKYTQVATQGAVREALSNALDVDNVLMSRAVENTANEGASPSVDYIANDNALLAYVPDNPGRRTPSAGYNFMWTDFNNGNADNGLAVRQFRMEENRADRIEGLWAYDQKLVSSALGVLFHNTIS